jgi:hypothetical protein
MALKKVRHRKGITIVPDTDALESIEGEIKVDSADNKIKVTLGAAAREVLTDSQTQTVTNKVINADNNTVSELELDNLKAGVLNTSTTLAGASDLQVPSALAVKTYIDDKDAAQNEASEITSAPTGTIAATNVQDAIAELDGDIQGHIGQATGAHAASAIVVTPSGNLSSINVQAALSELQGDADAASTHIAASTDVHGLTGGAAVVGTTSTQTLTNKTISGASIQVPTRLDVKQDTRANLTTYALTASNGQIVFATDEKAMFQVVDTELVSIGGAGIVKLTAGENLAINDLVYISTGTGNDSGRTAGQLYKVDASNDDRVEVLGFVLKTVLAAAIAEVQVSGILKGFTGLTAGKVYYASTTPGAISLTPPSANGQWIVAVILATSATEVVINPVASASAIFITDSETSFSIANNQTITNVTSLLIDGVSNRSFTIDYSIYRQTDTALSAVAEAGQLRGVYNTQSATWFMSDDYSGQNSGVTFSILGSGQIRYTSSNIAGANYVGTLKYTIRKTFGV